MRNSTSWSPSSNLLGHQYLLDSYRINENLHTALHDQSDPFIKIQALDSYIRYLVDRHLQAWPDTIYQSFRLDKMDLDIFDRAGQMKKEMDDLLLHNKIIFDSHDTIFAPIAERLGIMETMKHHSQAPEFHEQNSKIWEQEFWKYWLAIYDILSGGPQIKKDVQH